MAGTPHGAAAGRDLESMTRHRIVTLAGALAALLGACFCAAAQGFPVPPGSIPGAQQQACIRLESQLAAIGRGHLDPTRAAQISRNEDMLRRQQADRDRTVTRSRRLGCESSGFFSLFSNQPAECGPLAKQIQQMHGTIDRTMMELQRLQGGTADRESQRRSVLIALAQNDCGPQYRTTEANRPRGLFESLFGPGEITSPGPADVPQSSNYRTLCVRTCDGYYWPISFSTVPGRFQGDAKICQRMCPAAPVVLFTHRNPGEDVAQAVSLGGQTYSDMPNAFLYRKQFNSACSCRRAGETWARALQHLDDTIERGDIVVTEERAKQLSKPREQRPSRASTRGRGETESAPPSDTGPVGTPPQRGNVSSEAGNADGKVRNVGPTFLPAH
ncbi:MAG: DUF2865 domain-containing protein [Rhizobiales bacterium]|nr:DUF2865 domain-containing protein [Hyphomicrobiales bacterium]